MRIGAILVTYAFDPEPLFASVAGTKHTVKWYIHHHGDDLQLEQKLVEYASGGNVDLHLHRLNRGLSRSWNDGIESSIKDGNDYTLLLNDDLFFYEGAFDAFIEFVVENPDVGIAIAHGFEPHIGVVTQQGAACCAFSKSVIETIGYFDENFLLAYCEDTDYWQRAMKSGVVILEDRRKLVEHYRSKTYRTSSPEKQQRIMRAIEANEAYFIRKWGGLWKGEPSDIKFELPFNDGRFGLKIDSATRAAPYGYPYDRAQGFSENMVHVHSSGDVWFPQGQVCGKAGEGLWLEGLLLANDSAENGGTRVRRHPGRGSVHGLVQGRRVLGNPRREPPAAGTSRAIDREISSHPRGVGSVHVFGGRDARADKGNRNCSCDGRLPSDRIVSTEAQSGRTAGTPTRGQRERSPPLIQRRRLGTLAQPAGT